MTNTGQNLKPKLSNIAIFGANGRLGKEVATALTNSDYTGQIRLIVRSKKNLALLKKAFPKAEYTIADYLGIDSLIAALDGVDGVFLVTPNRLDEENAMQNFIFAARRRVGAIKHIVRILGDPPGMHWSKVPDTLRNAPGGTAIQHLIAKDILLKSRLPITYVNIAAYFMQNLSGPLFSLGLRQHRTLVCPRNRQMAWIDCADIGRSCAALLTSDDHRHIGHTYHLDNGHDILSFDQVASLMSEVFEEPIVYNGTDRAFVNLKHMRNIEIDVDPPLLKEDYFVTYSQFEQDNQTAWRKTDIVEYLTSTKAKTLAQWLGENKEAILNSTELPRRYR